MRQLNQLLSQMRKPILKPQTFCYTFFDLGKNNITTEIIAIIGNSVVSKTKTVGLILSANVGLVAFTVAFTMTFPALPIKAKANG